MPVGRRKSEPLRRFRLGLWTCRGLLLALLPHVFIAPVIAQFRMSGSGSGALGSTSDADEEEYPGSGSGSGSGSGDFGTLLLVLVMI